MALRSQPRYNGNMSQAFLAGFSCLLLGLGFCIPPPAQALSPALRVNAEAGMRAAPWLNEVSPDERIRPVEASFDIDGVDVESVDVDGVDVESTDVESVDVDGVDVESVDVESTDVDSVDTGGVDVESVDIEPVQID